MSLHAATFRDPMSNDLGQFAARPPAGAPVHEVLRQAQMNCTDCCSSAPTS